MTTEELQRALTERGLCLSMFMSILVDWTVWLWCDTDPALGVFVGEGDSLDQAIRAALDRWDKTYPEAKN